MAFKIYTKTGDLGKTSLIGGTKVSKSHLRIESYGTVDELNSYIGLVNDLLTDEHSKNILKEMAGRKFQCFAYQTGKSYQVFVCIICFAGYN